MINPAHEAKRAEKERCRVILTSDAGKLFPEVAQTIAFSTDLTPHHAAIIYDAILIDFDATIDPSNPAIPEAFRDRQAGALVTSPQPTETDVDNAEGAADE